MAKYRKPENKGVPEPGLIRKPLKYLPGDEGYVMGKKQSRKIDTKGQ